MAESELTKQLTRIESMTNVELRAELKQRGCPTSGNKKDLLAKLRIALQKEYQDNSVGLTQNETSLPQTVIANDNQINTPVISENVYIPSVPIISIPRIDVPSNMPPTPEKHTRTSSVDSQTNKSVNTSTEDNNFEISESMNKSIEEKSDLPSIDSNSVKPSTITKDISSSINTDEKSELVQDNNRTDQSTLSITNKEQENIKKNESESAAIQQLKPIRSQIVPFIKSYNRSTINKINLSAELLKTLISDISLVSESIANAELDALINDDNIGSTSNGVTLEINIDNSDSMTIGDLADGKHPINRTVVMDVHTNHDDLHSKKKQNSTLAPIITDEPVRIKHALATDEPPSEILYIRGLTRPFSLFQLKELLSRYGKLIDGDFWLDKIKSQCFATYSTLEEAKTARETLDGCRWPSTNPKTLSVRFGRQEELQFSKTQDLPPDQMSVDSLDHAMQQQVDISAPYRSTSPVNGIKSRSDIQESKKIKSNEQMHSGFLISESDEEEKESKTVPNNEPSGKDLDDYFRKTKAKPSIYWLPLTEEQIIERDHEAARRRAQREENAALLDKKSHAKRKRSSSPYRRR